jgi:hypothetical protein
MGQGKMEFQQIKRLLRERLKAKGRVLVFSLEPFGFVFLHGGRQFVVFVLRYRFQKMFGPIPRNPEGHGPSIFRDDGDAAPLFLRRLFFRLEYGDECGVIRIHNRLICSAFPRRCQLQKLKSFAAMINDHPAPVNQWNSDITCLVLRKGLFL